eukprot:752393-Rhodomonas_salina.2
MGCEERMGDAMGERQKEDGRMDRGQGGREVDREEGAEAREKPPLAFSRPLFPELHATSNNATRRANIWVSLLFSLVPSAALCLHSSYLPTMRSASRRMPSSSFSFPSVSFDPFPFSPVSTNSVKLSQLECLLHARWVQWKHILDSCVLVQKRRPRCVLEEYQAR